MGGSIEAEKQRIREHIWALLEEERVAAFPGARGRIPNFTGAGRAADRLADTDAWKRSPTVKCNPDAPQRPVRLRDLPHIDLIVAGSVAVDRGGRRVGKGGGYSDLEFAIGRTVGCIDARTVVATTVHPLQVVAGPLPTTAHDFLLDLVVTADEVIRRRGHARQPSGVLPGHLTPEIREAVPILGELGI